MINDVFWWLPSPWNRNKQTRMGIKTKLQRPKSLTSMAKEEIRAAIVDGALAFGEQLSESVLADSLGISKTPVREALLQLKLEGLVDIEPQRGTFVFSLTQRQVREICRFREVIETAGLALAMELDAAELPRRLSAVLAGAASSRPYQGPARKLDAEFHTAILEASGNSYLISAYQTIATKIQALRARLPKHNEHVDACLESHATIVALVRAGETAAALESLRLHIQSTEESYLSANFQQVAETTTAFSRIAKRR
jgi:DNA-binding GntR family transcriptional regulator